MAIGPYFNDTSGYKAAAVLLACVAALSALSILLWRRSSLSGPEIAVYALGSAYILIAGLLLL